MIKTLVRSRQKRISDCYFCLPLAGWLIFPIARRNLVYVAFAVLLVFLSACVPEANSGGVDRAKMSNKDRSEECLAVEKLTYNLGSNAARYHVNIRRQSRFDHSSPLDISRLDCDIVALLSSIKDDSDIIVDIFFFEEEFLRTSFDICVGEVTFEGGLRLSEDQLALVSYQDLVGPFLDEVLSDGIANAKNNNCLRYMYRSSRADLEKWVNFDSQGHIKFSKKRERPAKSNSSVRNLKTFFDQQFLGNSTFVHPMGIFETSERIVILCGAFFPLTDEAKAFLERRYTSTITYCLNKIY